MTYLPKVQMHQAPATCKLLRFRIQYKFANLTPSMSTDATRGPAKRFAPLDPVKANPYKAPQLKGIVFDVDGTLWYVLSVSPLYTLFFFPIKVGGKRKRKCIVRSIIRTLYMQTRLWGLMYEISRTNSWI